MELTNHHLDKTLSGQQKLEKEVQDLKHQLSTSEKEKIAWQEGCAMLVKECRLQMEKEGHAREKVTEIQGKLANCKYVQWCMHANLYYNYVIYNARRAEKLALEEKYIKVIQQLPEKTAEVSQLKEQCNDLQLRLTESISERERGEDIKQKFVEVEQECNERKMENCQLKAELKSAGSSNILLQDQVGVYVKNTSSSFLYLCIVHAQIQMLEDNLRKSEEAAKHLEKELVEASSQLHCKEDEREILMKELELWKAQVCCLTSEKEHLEV